MWHCCFLNSKLQPNEKKKHKNFTKLQVSEDVEETVASIKEKLGDELDFIELDEAWKQF